MIELTAINGDIFLLNVDMIYKVTQRADTIISLSSGSTLRVKEKNDEILEKIIEYRRKIHVQYLEEI